MNENGKHMAKLHEERLQDLSLFVDITRYSVLLTRLCRVRTKLLLSFTTQCTSDMRLFLWEK